MYGVEIWGCSSLVHPHSFHAWHLEQIEQVQLRTLRMFFGGGTLHPIYIIQSKISAIIGLASLADARRSAISIY